jgi:hypothetical protein
MDSEPAPGVQPGLAERLEMLDPVHQAVDPAHRMERHQRQWQQRGDDDEELQHLVVDRRGQAAERDVDEHQRGGNQDRQGDRPAEHQMDDQRQREQVDPGDQHRGQRERPGVEGMRGLVEAQPEVLGHRANLRPVVERHHHQPEEHHRRNRAEPVVVHRGHAVLSTVGSLAEDLQGAQVGGDEGQARDPRRQ